MLVNKKSKNIDDSQNYIIILSLFHFQYLQIHSNIIHSPIKFTLLKINIKKNIQEWNKYVYHLLFFAFKYISL